MLKKSLNKKQKAEEILAILSKDNPSPQTELIYHSPFELLIAVLLSAQTTDKKVNEVTAVLFKQANTPETFLALGETALKTIIRPINYYATKAKHIIQTCQRLVEYYDQQIPNTREGLESLPGVGRKTANVILNIIFHQPTLAVDTHIFRVSHRLGLSQGKTPRDVENDLLKIIDKRLLSQAHHWLILHGRYICIARNPKCAICPIQDYCKYYRA